MQVLIAGPPLWVRMVRFRVAPRIPGIAMMATEKYQEATNHISTRLLSEANTDIAVIHFGLGEMADAYTLVAKLQEAGRITVIGVCPPEHEAGMRDAGCHAVVTDPQSYGSVADLIVVYIRGIKSTPNPA